MSAKTHVSAHSTEASLNGSSAADWDIEIRPQASWTDVRLDELWQYRDLIGLFVRRDFIAKYKQTILGPLWHFIQPLFTTVIFTVIFGNVAGISTDGLPKFVFYMAGTVLWNYFSKSITATSNTFIANASMFGKVYFPRLAVPVSILLSNLIAFGIQFLFFLCFLVYFMVDGAPVEPNSWILLTPVLLLMMAGLGLGFGVIVSSLTTKYRDLTQLVSFGVSLLMYACPVIYPLSTIPEQYRWIVVLNPITPIIETFRFAFLGAGTVDLWHLLYSGGFTIVVLVVGVVIFKRVERTFMDTV